MGEKWCAGMRNFRIKAWGRKRFGGIRNLKGERVERKCAQPFLYMSCPK